MTTESTRKCSQSTPRCGRPPLDFGTDRPEAKARRCAHPTESPEVLARLEWLDDLIFAAIDGDAAALQDARAAWARSLAELGGTDALEESRRQYLRRAESVWQELRDQPNHPPHKVFAAIEIISLLADEAW